MVVYHIVLFRLASDASQQQIKTFVDFTRAMVGVVPGLISIEVGPCLKGTLQRSRGYDFGLTALLEKAEDLPVYAKHPAHLLVAASREAIGVPGEVVAFDFESGLSFA